MPSRQVGFSQFGRDARLKEEKEESNGR